MSFELNPTDGYETEINGVEMRYNATVGAYEVVPLQGMAFPTLTQTWEKPQIYDIEDTNHNIDLSLSSYFIATVVDSGSTITATNLTDGQQGTIRLFGMDNVVAFDTMFVMKDTPTDTVGLHILKFEVVENKVFVWVLHDNE